MKTPGPDGSIVEATAFVVMEESRGWIRPLATFGSQSGAEENIRVRLEGDAANQAWGGVPGSHKWYYVPVVHTP